MSHNTNLGITSNRDARPKNSTIAAKQVWELSANFIEDFNILKVLTFSSYIHAHIV
jgi:hypothetical protein